MKVIHISADETLNETDPRYIAALTSLRQRRVSELEGRIEELQLQYDRHYKAGGPLGGNDGNEKNKLSHRKKAKKCKE